MRKVRYQGACSLDGYIAGPQDNYDWITLEPEIDLDVLYKQFDTLLMGRYTYEIVSAAERVSAVSRYLWLHGSSDSRITWRLKLSARIWGAGSLSCMGSPDMISGFTAAESCFLSF